MSIKKHIDREVDRTMQSLDGLEPAKTDAFFYSRLTAKLEHREEVAGAGKGSLEYGFAFAVAAVLLIISLNVISISKYNQILEQDSITSTSSRDELVEELASEYQVVDLNYYETFEAE